MFYSDIETVYYKETDIQRTYESGGYQTVFMNKKCKTAYFQLFFPRNEKQNFSLIFNKNIGYICNSYLTDYNKIFCTSIVYAVTHKSYHYYITLEKCYYLQNRKLGTV